LLAARDARAAYIGRLRTERSLTAERIVTLEARAAAAQARARTATVTAQTAPTAAAFVAQPLLSAPPDAAGPPDDPAPPPASGNRLTVLSTGYSLKGGTATGLPVGRGVVAVDPSVIPLGTRLFIPG